MCGIRLGGVEGGVCVLGCLCSWFVSFCCFFPVFVVLCDTYSSSFVPVGGLSCLLGL